MKKIILFVADGTEEIEAVVPTDVLRRAGAEVDVVSVRDKTVTMSRKIAVVADKLLDEIIPSDYDGVIIPGGMPGAINISENQKAVSIIRKLMSDGKLVASICASPAVVLAKHGIIDGKNATCYPAEDFISMMNKCRYIEEDVVQDKNLITANGPKSAFGFALKICDYLGVTPRF